MKSSYLAHNTMINSASPINQQMGGGGGGFQTPGSTCDVNNMEKITLLTWIILNRDLNMFHILISKALKGIFHMTLKFYGASVFVVFSLGNPLPRP